MDLDAKLTRESDFWDAKQGELTHARDPALYRVDPDDITDRSVPWLPYIGFPAYLGAMFDHLGPLAGKRVLDLGTGSGFVASLLAARGAVVDAVDVSEASLRVARWRADISGVADRVTFHRAPAETLPFENGRFDAVCGAFVLHHLDLTSAAPEIGRVLREGGRGAFIETSGRSALLNWARGLLPGRFGIEKASSDDEAPLSESALTTLERTFGHTVRSEVPATLFFRMACYIPPLHRRPFSALWSLMDMQMHRVEALRTQSYHCVITFEASHEHYRQQN